MPYEYELYARIAAMVAKPILIANWKMHPRARSDARQLFAATRKIAERSPGPVIVAPPSVYLSELASAYTGKKIQFAAQHAREGDIGAYTGEISMAQVKDAKARFVLVGHAERRAAGESDDDTRAQVGSALSLSLTPIICVGERVRSAGGEHFHFIRAQLRAAFGDVADGAVQKCLVAYEPIWAIGASEAMPPRQMHEMAIFIRKTLVELRGERAQNLKILYGGAVDESNARAMLAEGDVAGLLVGRVSTNAEEFAALIRSITTKQ